jgi:membrane protein implicated in regulation of membrane protease activity
MYLIAIAWIYVAFMMAVAEATHVQGTVIGAILTFVLYGVAPVSLLMYLMGHPGRRRARRAREAREDAAAGAAASAEPDAGSQPPTDAVAPVRKEP